MCSMVRWREFREFFLWSLGIFSKRIVGGLILWFLGSFFVYFGFIG